MPGLARSRQLVDRLRDADAQAVQARRTGSHPAVPVLAVGYPPGRVGDQLTIEPEPRSSVDVEVVGSATAFPGLAGLPMLVLPADALFSAVPTQDPRPRPRPNPPPSPFPTVQLWDGLGLQDLTRTLAAHAVNGQNVATAEAVRRQPELEAARQALPFQRALGWGAALVSLVAFALYVDRTVSLAGAADLLLARVGLGSRGVRRSRVLEPVVLTVLSGVLALVAVLLLRPMAARLLDPQRSAVPPFVLTIDARVVALGVAFLSRRGPARRRRDPRPATVALPGSGPARWLTGFAARPPCAARGCCASIPRRRGRRTRCGAWTPTSRPAS